MYESRCVLYNIEFVVSLDITKRTVIEILSNHDTGKFTRTYAYTTIPFSDILQVIENNRLADYPAETYDRYT